MPTLLSPRGAAKAPEEQQDATMKPKGVMGRIKSTFKLGRRKSSSSSSSSSAAAAATASAAFASDDKDDATAAAAAMEEPESKHENNKTDGYEDKAEIEIRHFNAAENDDDSDNGDDDDLEKPPAPAAQVAAAAKNERVSTFELPAKSAKDDGGDEQDDYENEEVFACDYKANGGPAQAESDDDDDEQVEVFDHENEGGTRSGGTSSSGSGSGTSSGDRGTNNETPPAPAAAARLAAPTVATPVEDKDQSYVAPHESNLMVVGVSPAKFRTTAMSSGPSLSPVKRSQPRPPPLATIASTRPNQDQVDSTSNQEPPMAASGPSRADAEQSLGDRIASAHSTRPTHRPCDVAVPPNRSQLLSEFQFGTEGLGGSSTSSSSPVPSSPMKRRGNASPSLQPRRSFQREQELSINASTTTTPIAVAAPSPKRKPDTPSALPSSSRAPRMERRNSLQGITEEHAHDSALPISSSSPFEETPLPPRPSAGAGRRRSAAAAASAMEAPILASSFVASAAAFPEIHDDHNTSPQATDSPNHDDTYSHDQSCDHDEELQHHDTSAASAFDAGAAITHEFGERVARLLGADPWGDRLDGFDAILYQIKKTDLAASKTKRELFCATVAAVQCGVEDRVAPVMYCALECLKGVLKEYAPVFDRSFLKYAPMNEQLSTLTRAVVGKLGDSNKRTQREATQTVVRLAKLKKLHVLPHVLLHLSAKEIAPRQRVETLRVLVKELGVDCSKATAMNVEVVMQFTVPVLKIAEEKTRKAAVELIAELHMVNGQAVNAQLSGVKPEMLRVINQEDLTFTDMKDEEKLQQQQQQAAHNANQAEETGDSDAFAGMALVAVPVEDAKPTQVLLEGLLLQAQTVVGPVCWRKLESKTWSDRKEALVDIEKSITEAKSDLRDVKPAFHSVVQHNFGAYCTVVYRALSDSIAPVVNSAMDAFSTLLKIYGPCVEWREDTVRDLVLLTVMRLFSTMQKPNNRTNRAACRCILKLTRLTNPHSLRYALSCVFANDTDPLVQMHLLRLLIPEFGFPSGGGISAARVLDAVALALAHTNDKVRKTAIDVALCTHRLVGKQLVLKKLTEAGVKPVVLKELEKNFVEIEIHKDTERPQTVHATGVAISATGGPSAAGMGLPPVQFGGEHSRRQLHSAPVGLGKLHCTPPTGADNDDCESDTFGGASSFCRPTVLSNEEENLMDSILGSDDF